MPRAIVNLQDPADLRAVQGQWRFAPGFIPGQPNEGLVAWYRIKVTLPETVQGQDIRSGRVLFETCVDDYGEIWINGVCDRERGAVQGFNVPQRVVVTTEPQPGQQYTIAVLAVNGPLGQPGGGVFVRYASLALEWPTPAARR